MSTLRWISILVSCAILTACASATSVSTPTQVEAAPTQQPTLPLPSPLPSPTLEPAGLGVPAMAYVAGQLNLLVISQWTAEPREGFAPIPLQDYNYAFSQDGKSLAVVSDSQLYLIDLPSWNYRTAELDGHGPVYAMLYSPDGKRLALAGGNSGTQLQLVDAGSGRVQANTQAGFSIRRLKFTADGKTLMAYGPQLATTGVAANVAVSVGAPKAALYALPDLSLLWSVKLNGVRDGTFPKKGDIASIPDLYQPGWALYFAPGLAFAPNEDVLYVVHGDEDRLTTVDFGARKVKTVDLHLNTSWLERLLSLTAGVAHAKGMDGTTKEAVLSLDGKSLFVIGQTQAFQPDANGNWNTAVTPLGLQVIDPQDGTLIEKIDTEALSIRLSPDGKQFFLTGWTQTGPWTDVYDLSSRSLVRHLDEMSLEPTRRLDGTPILASTRATDGYISYVTLLDPQTLAAISERKRTGDIVWLVYP